MAGEKKLNDLNDVLVGVENELLRRKVSRQDDTIDYAMDIINKAADAGAIELVDCDGDGDEDCGDEEDGDKE